MPQVAFGSKAAADDVREQYDEYLCPDDDRRLKTVTFRSDTPEEVLDRLRTEAAASTQSRSVSAELSQGDRDRISDLGGFDRTTTHSSWKAAKGVFQREGLTDRWNDALGALVDYDDPVEGAEEWIRTHREHKQGGSARGGVTGGVRDEGEEDVAADRRAARGAAKALEGQCDHAADHCQLGDPEACNYLRDVCGLDDEDVQDLADRRDGDADQEDGAGEDQDLTDTTTSTRTRAWWLGTVLALLVVPFPVVAAAAVYLQGGRPDPLLAGLAFFEAAAFTIWVVGQGVGSAALDVIGGQGGGRNG